MYSLNLNLNYYLGTKCSSMIVIIVNIVIFLALKGNIFNIINLFIIMLEWKFYYHELLIIIYLILLYIIK